MLLTSRKARLTLWTLSICSLIVLGLCLFLGSVVSADKLRRLEPGMTREAVAQVIGKPSRITGDGVWEYERWGNPGWVSVHFDGNDRLVLVNDESVFP